MTNRIDKLKRLTQLNAIASNEVEVSTYLEKTLKVSLSKDRLGSVIASTGKGKHVLLTAPMDEAGMIISQVTPQGMIKFQNVGSMSAKTALNQLFTITNKDKTHLATLIGKPISLQSKEEQSKVDDMKTLYLDAGFTSEKQVFKQGIQIGDMVTRFSPFNTLANNRFMSKALETRASVYVLSELMNDLNDLDITLFGAFTVQHKMSMKGAKTSSYMVEPEIALSLDTVEATDHMGDNSIKLGCGPVIFFYDQGLIAHPRLRRYILDLCKQHQIPYQEASELNGLNEGHYLQLSKLGTATISIGIPLRNKYTHNQVVDINDLENTYTLLKILMQTLNDQTINNILFN